MIAFEEYIALLQGLIRIPSFSREEASACDFLEAWLLEHGADAVGEQYPLRREGNNIILEEKGRGDARPLMLLNAHIDTVRPAASYTRDPFSADIKGDTLYGLGSNDDGGSLVALLAAYLRLLLVERPYRLVWTATAEEEVCGREGIERILPSIGPVTLGIIGEPTKMQLAVAERGLMVLDCKVRGRSGHAAREEGVNAIYGALPAIEWFRDYRFEKVSPWLGPVKMSVTVIKSGTQHNVVPDLCEFVVDVRSNGMYSNVEVLERIKALAPCEVAARSTRLSSSHIDEGHPVLQRARALGLETFGSPTCSNQTLCPFPTVKIGPGDSARSHTADEFIRLSEIRSGIDTYVELLQAIELR